MYNQQQNSPTPLSMKLTYQCDLKELKKLAQDILKFASDSKLQEKTTYALNLCLDEVITNIISYGFKNSPKSNIDLVLSINDGVIIAKITDKGDPFNPLKDTHKKKLRPDASIEDRAIGGLGVYFLHKYMDQIMYERNEGRNVLTLIVKTH